MWAPKQAVVSTTRYETNFSISSIGLYNIPILAFCEDSTYNVRVEKIWVNTKEQTVADK